jgi:hypothetical protein
VIALGAGFLTAAIRPIGDAEVLPFDLPLHGSREVRSVSVSVHSMGLQHHWQERHHPMRLILYVALLWRCGIHRCSPDQARIRVPDHPCVSLRA